MRAIAGALALMVALSATAAAQGKTNEEKYQEKLQKEFVSKIQWVKSLEKAQEAAAAQNKLIFGYFTRSYAP